MAIALLDPSSGLQYHKIYFLSCADQSPLMSPVWCYIQCLLSDMYTYGKWYSCSWLSLLHFFSNHWSVNVAERRQNMWRWAPARFEDCQWYHDFLFFIFFPPHRCQSGFYWYMFKARVQERVNGWSTRRAATADDIFGGGDVMSRKKPLPFPAFFPADEWLFSSPNRKVVYPGPHSPVRIGLVLVVWI